MRQKIKILVIDIDGTLTDGKIYIGNSGEILKAFNIKDGYGIGNILPSVNIIPVIMTGRISQIVKNRCKELGITEIYQGVLDKAQKLDEIIEKLNKDIEGCKSSVLGGVMSNNQGVEAEHIAITYEAIAYIGDDLNDFECMKKIKDTRGLIGCPRDAAEKIKELADFVSEKNGGDGAVREFIEWIADG